MHVDVYKVFRNLMQTKYLKDHYFIESCKPFFSKYTEETNIDGAALRIYLEENNRLIGCEGRQTICEIGVFKDGKLVNVSNDIEKPIQKIVINKDVWEIEQF